MEAIHHKTKELEMERQKRKIDTAYSSKHVTKQDCEPIVMPMALSNQLLKVSTFLNYDDVDPAKVLLRHEDRIRQDSYKTTKLTMLQCQNDAKNMSESKSSSCGSLDMVKLSIVDSKLTPIDYHPSKNIHKGNIQRLTTEMGESSKTTCIYTGESPILGLTSDIMAEILVFLHPSEVLDIVSYPLCKQWTQSYTNDHDLWKVLCSREPFKVDHGDCQVNGKQELQHYSIKVKGDRILVVSRHRLLYISFVRCVNYLRSLKQGNRNTASMKPIDRSIDIAPGLASGGEAPQQFFGVLDREFLANEVSPHSSKQEIHTQGVKRCDSDTKIVVPNNKRPRYGKSMITTRLLGPSSTGTPSYLALPRSCAIFSIVNWMVAHAHVEGIQIMCIEALPRLLEDEQHRTTAQRAGLSDAIFRAMVAYPDSVNLHSAAFHTLVLLGRPLGGQEGMIIDLVDRPILRSLSSSGIAFLDLEATRGNRSEQRIPIVLDSMRRFEQEEKLQTRACWALVNLALVPSQKDVIILNGGIEATLRAMENHPKSHEVQFRALFALINLAIPCTKNSTTSATESIEHKILSTCVEKMAKLVVSAVMNFPFCSSIRHKAGLVLHNLSLSYDYIPTLLWTRHCYNLLCWSAKYDVNDPVPQRSSIAAVGRMNEYMRHRKEMEKKFSRWIDSEPDLPSRFHATQHHDPAL